MSAPRQTLAFVDLETTGATATADRITEIGIVEVDADGVREWSTLVNPGAAIPPFIQTLTGITDAMVREAPAFEDIAGEVFERLRGRTFIAHNARFDYGFLKNEFRRVGLDFRATVVCTVKLSRRLFPGHRKHSLDALIERHDLQAGGRHRALADAQLIHQFWQKAEVLHGEEAFAAALRELSARPSLPPQLDPGIVDELPEGPGVYLFYGENALPLYVGKAKDIRKRVLSHFAGDHASAKEMSLSQQVRRIDWIATGGEIGALLREAALVKELQPSHNRHLRRNEELCSIVLRDHGEGLVTPEVIFARDVDFGNEPALYGLFRHAKEARDTLAELAPLHGLCHGLLGLEKLAAGKPCFAHQVRKCKGACVGRESHAAHTVRLVHALAPLRLTPWPFPGPAVLREGDEQVIVDRWSFLGTARTEEEAWSLLEARRPPFDKDSYRILSRITQKLRPLASHDAGK